MGGSRSRAKPSKRPGHKINGANFADRFFLGAGLGIISVRYQYDKKYSENFEGQTTGRANQCKSCFNNFVLNETRTTTGSGVNFTLGAIVKPIDYLQFGISYVTGSAYQLNDSYNGNMTSNWNNFDYYNNGKPLNSVSSKTYDDPVNYGLSTPGRLTFGTAIFIPKKGFITADIELVNYSSATTNNFSKQDFTYQIDADAEINSVASSRFKSVTNIRIGAEYRFNKFRVRAGYNAMGDPYSRKPTERINYSLTNLSSFSGGVGYRKSNLFVDLAIVYTQGDGYYVPYSLKNFPSPDYTYNNSTTRIMFTVGFPF
jgi:long-subunit fatty acid transport protein